MADVTKTGTSDAPFDVWLWHKHWADDTLTYSFPSDGSFFSYKDTDQVTPLTQVQEAAVRMALDEISSIANIQFSEITETATDQATVRFGLVEKLEGAEAFLPGTGERAGDSFYGTDTDNPLVGNEAFVYFTHEIGHIMGLDHGHEFPKFAKSEFNSQEYTIMTYTDYVGDKRTFEFESGVHGWAQSYMQLDIAALQFLYGANYSASGEAWSGDTVYSFNPKTGEMSINGVGLVVPTGNRIFRTIWDGDGEDTYDLSNYKSNLKVDLSAGGWSTFSKKQVVDLNGQGKGPAQLAEGSVANALLVDGDERGLIENVIGGTGDDSVHGNKVANDLRGGDGADHLVGRKGADALWGDSGRDVLKGGKGRDGLKGGKGDDQLKGGDQADTLIGGGGQDKLHGGKGDDMLFGGAGRDILIGGKGQDTMTGGAGEDTFKFGGKGESKPGAGSDIITDFTSGEDTLDLSALKGPEMTLVLNGPFTGMDASVVTRDRGADTWVLVDVDGDAKADFRVILQGTDSVAAGDFLL